MHSNPNRSTRSDSQPDWVCYPCGIKWGFSKLPRLSTYHEDNCGVCGVRTHVTEARDFGYLTPGWNGKAA